MNNYTNNGQKPAGRQTALTLKVLLIIYQHFILAFYTVLQEERKKMTFSERTLNT